MASAIVVGEGRLAAFVTKLLCSSGTPVAVYGASNSVRDTVETMLQKHVEETFPLQFIDDLRHQQTMLSRLLKNLRMTDDASRLHGEVIINATGSSSSALLRVVRRFVPDAPVMCLSGNTSDGKTVAVQVYEPFEITRIAQIMPSSTSDSISIERVRSLLKKANVAEVSAEQGGVAKRALDPWKGYVSSTPQLERVIASLVPDRSVSAYSQAVMH